MIQEATPLSGPAKNASPMLRVDEVTKFFGERRRLKLGETDVVQALRGVGLALQRGQVLGLVGESGSGKTTLFRVIAGLIKPSSGGVFLDGSDVSTLKGGGLRDFHRKVQMVFQDPFSSLDPRRTIRWTIGEPLRAQKLSNKREHRDRVDSLMLRLGLDPALGKRYPHQFSGGQRQRIAIARALTVDPELILLDEPLSALDMSIQAQVINLLKEIQVEKNLSYLLVAHDLSVIQHVSDHVAVMYLGRIVETGTRKEVYSAPAHPYTSALLSAAPVPDPSIERKRERRIPLGEPASPSNPPSGCSFHPRCWRAREVAAGGTEPVLSIDGDAIPLRCIKEDPGLEGTGQMAACHFPLAH
jgi:oligopeptide/dipeptide ABC transporter ATP-binding protein